MKKNDALIYGILNSIDPKWDTIEMRRKSIEEINYECYIIQRDYERLKKLILKEQKKYEKNKCKP